MLGAGFSRAISDRMPLTDELGQLVVERLAAKGLTGAKRTFSGGYFEAWLSRLAEPQPDLDDADNAQNRATFLRISWEIRRVLKEREIEVAGADAPWWLLKLIGVAQARGSTLITLNYDTLVEKAIDAARCTDWTTTETVYSMDVLRNVPPIPIVQGALGRHSPQRAFRLIKLHGSTDTHWVSGDVSGATINRWPGHVPWGVTEVEDVEERQTRLPGRSAFIVPPAAAKSSFYDNPVTRQLWQDAANALRGATFDDAVALVGYSLPPTDLVMSGMISEHLPDRELALVDIVNPSASEVIGRLRTIGLDSPLKPWDGDDAVSTYVEWLELQTSHRAHQRLRNILPDQVDPPVLVATSEIHAAAVIGLGSDGSDGQPVELKIVPLGTLLDVMQRTPWEVHQEPIRASSLQGLPTTGLFVRYSTARRRELLT